MTGYGQASSVGWLMRGVRSAILLATLLMIGCEPAALVAKPPPANWQTIQGATAAQATTPFRLRAPADLKKQDVQGIDSLMGQYQSPTMKLTYDYGWYSDPLDGEGLDGYWTTINGQRARIASKKDYIGVHFPDIDGQVKLTVWVQLTGAKPETCEMIFATIEFK